MITFFDYPANFAMETLADGIIPQNAIAAVMAFMDLVAFAGGLLYVKIKQLLRGRMFFFPPLLFALRYILLAFVPGWIGAISDSIFIGFANGCGVPCVISAASAKAGKDAVSVAMPMISAALYLGQFLSPFVVSSASSILGNGIASHLPYFTAISAAILMILWSFVTLSSREKHQSQQSLS